MSHIPILRKCPGPFRKTLILVGGQENHGKTTLCSKLLKNDVGYISFDQMTWEDDLNISKTKDMKSKRGHRYMIPNAFKYIMPDYNKFLDYTNKKIESIEQDIILIDSYYFTKDDFYKKFVSDIGNKYRIWEMKRLWLCI